MLAICVRFRIENLVRPNVAYYTRALVSKACKGQGLAHIQDLSTVDFVAKKGVLGSFSRSTVRRGQWLAPIEQVNDVQVVESTNTHLRRNVGVKVPGVGWITKFRTVRRRVAVDIHPIDSSEPRMSLTQSLSIEYLFHVIKKLALMRSAPSTPPDVPGVAMKPLRRAATAIELGLDTDAVDCDPRRSSGSQRNCSMRFTPSCDTRGRDGKRNDCFQFRIFWRVT